MWSCRVHVNANIGITLQYGKSFCWFNFTTVYWLLAVPGDSIGTVVMKTVKVQSVDKRLQVTYAHIDID